MLWDFVIKILTHTCSFSSFHVEGLERSFGDFEDLFCAASSQTIPHGSGLHGREIAGSSVQLAAVEDDGIKLGYVMERCHFSSIIPRNTYCDLCRSTVKVDLCMYASPLHRESPPPPTLQYGVLLLCWARAWYIHLSHRFICLD